MEAGDLDSSERVMIAQRSHEPPVMITAFLELLLRVGHEVLRQPP